MIAEYACQTNISDRVEITITLAIVDRETFPKIYICQLKKVKIVQISYSMFNKLTEAITHISIINSLKSILLTPS